MRRALAALAGSCLLTLLAPLAGAQVNPPVPAPSGPINPPIPPVGPPPPLEPLPPSPLPEVTPYPVGSASPGPAVTPVPVESTAPFPIPGESTEPAPAPTQPPIVVDPAQVGVEPGQSVRARVNSAAGTITATSADPTIATVAVDQLQRALFVYGQKVGLTTITVGDARGLTREVPVRVAYSAGTIAGEISLRVTGDPAGRSFLRQALAVAARTAATARSGARVIVDPGSIDVGHPLPTDDRVAIEVPLQIVGAAYFAAVGTTRVDVTNDAQPEIAPSELLVSDYPERLTADGVLFTATIDRAHAKRFLYYHFNPPTEPERRILIKVTNTTVRVATIDLISAFAGPGTNAMEIGHDATRSFLVRERRNEGTVVTIPPQSTVNLFDHPLPPNNVVTGIFQVREVTGDPLKLAIVAQRADAPLDQPVDAANLLSGGAPHARGVYPVPQFFADYTYFVDGPPLAIPIGQLPLPNLRQGEALSGDYGVQQSMHVVIVNTTRYGQAIALYANPRGGAATGTFLIDDTLVQAHRLPAFSRYKIWQETIPPGTYRTLQISTMPEGGSSYPLQLIFAQDDGSVAPGAPGSPVH